jgi:hypothetical protein
MFETYAQYKDLDLEFSVCDDGSPEPAVVPTGTRWLIHLTRLPRKHGPLNPCVPINRAVEASTGEIVVLTTPEVVHTTPVLYEMLELLQDPDDYVMASVKDTRGPWIAGPRTRYNQSGRLPVPAGGHFHFLTMLHRVLWKKAGGYDEEYRHGQACDDNDWLWRLCDVGVHFKTTKGAVQHSPTHVTWNLPHNRALFLTKWPDERRKPLERRGLK